MKCKHCTEKDKEIATLKKRIMELRPEKAHFDMDGIQTACGLDVYEVNAIDNIEEVNCKTCLKKWKSMKKKWENEEEKDRRLIR